VCNFSLATTEKRKKGDKWEDATEWHRVVAFGKLAEICGEYLSKGKQVYIDGRIQYGSYEKNGHTIYTTDIIAQQMVMLSGGSRQEQRPQQDSGPQFDMEDDIPF
jgi:single-strand DNA-binding protein